MFPLVHPLYPSSLVLHFVTAGGKRCQGRTERLGTRSSPSRTTSRRDASMRQTRRNARSTLASTCARASGHGERGGVGGGASYLILDSRIHKCYPWCFTPLFLCLSLSLCMSLSLPALCSRCPRSMPFFRYGINLPTGQTVDGDGGTDDPLRTRKEICATNSQTGAYRGNTDK